MSKFWKDPIFQGLAGLAAGVLLPPLLPALLGGSSAAAAGGATAAAAASGGAAAGGLAAGGSVAGGLAGAGAIAPGAITTGASLGITQGAAPIVAEGSKFLGQEAIKKAAKGAAAKAVTQGIFGTNPEDQTVVNATQPQRPSPPPLSTSPTPLGQGLTPEERQQLALQQQFGNRSALTFRRA